MSSSLKTLQRIQKFQIDEQRKILVEWQNREEKLLNDLRRLTQEYEREKEFAEKNGMIGNFGAYTKRYLQYRDAMEQDLEATRKKIAEIRDIISDMFKEQKTYEIVERQRKEKAQKEEDLKTQKMLDEIGTNNYIKKEKKIDKEKNNDI